MADNEILDRLGRIEDRQIKMHGDVRVAIDRSDAMHNRVTLLEETTAGHGRQLARQKGEATILGGLGSLIALFLLELGKSILGKSQ